MATLVSTFNCWGANCFCNAIDATSCDGMYQDNDYYRAIYCFCGTESASLSNYFANGYNTEEQR